MMYLLDTNIILEVLLDQDRADEVEQFLQATEPEKLHISEFSLYSFGILLTRRKLQGIFLQMTNDLLVSGGVRILRLGVVDMQAVVAASQQFNLDFDDAYQYVVAQQFGLALVSFDTDFDRTDLGRKTPADLLKRHEN
jgi:predicted nucleic acid-binding protein